MVTATGYQIRAPIKPVCVAKAPNAPIKPQITVTAGTVDVAAKLNAKEQYVY